MLLVSFCGCSVGQFNWPHALACPSENTIFVADMNNWRVQKLLESRGFMHYNVVHEDRGV